ncbi:[FeFe] hydrogenase H-cluster radical SAM maturase HydE [Anaerosalibacter bizertensis]|uniref:[FeFe] hydrogenase H-cluster radical SAM maturase HydE n=1 Tax=Anaerosalibacter bizertensis TaxID=932217 RepID=A0A844FFI0_9FIRM|nr:[FeFe] hydrogenase H-cluster radical SAM maturase HydE [Anaerosalibacter bizertensis]MBU5293575.1 [FeFe] hydrogenase H-cluster radical SAM maturase HydE [Anaerosalibacter bizertensis]MCB5559439.1 [FeFe] hydrogenase H-cluster radical SAM maturase HydE [Anaerosalibacter bizertensis]MSS42783.1 [FeFe] hydrogenase H-cluster radical SAM maturase HydE [Anaerosalibacter bizertensis]
MKNTLDKLYKDNYLNKEEIIFILDNINSKWESYLFKLARKTLFRTYGNRVFVRGLLEFSNYCRNNCIYCGIRKDNKNVDRYRLSKKEILSSLSESSRLGYNTFVLQSGEDIYYTDEYLEDLIKEIKLKYPEIALTLSIGERSFKSYEKLFKAGTDRFLLRHETANSTIYNNIHPDMDWNRRKGSLYDLKKIGYQTGAGFIVGLPEQTNKVLAEDLLFLKELEPAMVGIGPLIPHPNTPLKKEKIGSPEKTIILIALTRLLLPEALIPVTTALNTIYKYGFESGVLAGGNVIMLNISPNYVRKKYEIYKNKETKDAKELDIFRKRAKKIGFIVDMERGDNLNFRGNKNV